MASFIFSIFFVWACFSSSSKCQVSSQYGQLSRKLNNMRRTFEREISNLKYEVQDLKIELEEERSFTASLLKQGAKYQPSDDNETNTDTFVELRESITDIKNAMEVHDAEMKEIAIEIDTLKETHTAVLDKFKQHEKRIDKHGSSINLLHEDISNIRSDMSGIQMNISNFKSESDDSISKGTFDINAVTLINAFKYEKLERTHFQRDVLMTLNNSRHTDSLHQSEFEESIQQVVEDIRDELNIQMLNSTSSVANTVSDIKSSIEDFDKSLTSLLRSAEHVNSSLRELRGNEENRNEDLAQLHNRTAELELVCGHGTPYADGKSYKCRCQNGYTGKHCVELTSCYEILHSGVGTTSGIYDVRLYQSNKVISVFCDMETDGGGWTVFQYRFNGSVDFYQTFEQYENGFGSLNGEFWLGLQYTQEMTKQAKSELRIDLEAADGDTAYHTFQDFRLSSSPEYILNIGAVAGTAGDASKGLSYNNGLQFSAINRDKTGYKNCIEKNRGGWWYDYCAYANLNGEYVTPGSKSTYNSGEGGVTYRCFKERKSLKSTKMMFRKV